MNLIYVPPPLEIFLQEDYWAIHEAAFAFTQWPESDLFQNFICYSLKKTDHGLGMNRQYVYLPETFKIEPDLYGKEFQIVYNDLKTAVESRRIGSNYLRIIDVIYFVRPVDAIIWALLDGIIFPVQESCQKNWSESDFKFTRIQNFFGRTSTITVLLNIELYCRSLSFLEIS